jgi:hypothetical protein
MKQIFEYGYYQYLLWGFPPGVCIVACFVLGAWFVLSDFRSTDHRKTRTVVHIMRWSERRTAARTTFEMSALVRRRSSCSR